MLTYPLAQSPILELSAKLFADFDLVSSKSNTMPIILDTSCRVIGLFGFMVPSLYPPIYPALVAFRISS